MKPLNNSRKRIQVDKDKTMALVAIGFASVVLVAGVMISKALWSQANYLGKVADQKEVARDQLNENKESIDALRESYNEFNGQNPNLIGGSADGDSQRDGENSKLVLDALPSEYDFPATITSLEGFVKDYEINGIEGIDESAEYEDAPKNGNYVEIPLTLEFTSTYDNHKKVIADLKKSIRPFSITKLEITGSSSELDTIMDVVTYYQPEAGFKIERKTVQ